MRFSLVTALTIVAIFSVTHASGNAAIENNPAVSDQAQNADAGTPAPLVVAIHNAPPFCFKDENGKWTGITIELWESVAKKLGYSYTYRELELQAMLDRIAENEVQVGAAATAVTAKRLERMNFSSTYYGIGLGIATGIKKENIIINFVHHVLTLNFAKALIALSGVILAAGVFIWLAERRHRNGQFGGEAFDGLGNGFWWSAVTMSTVGYGDRVPVTFWGRAIGCIWMFTSILIISGLTGSIATALTMGQINDRVTTLADLTEMKVGVVEGSAAEDFLRSRGITTSTFGSVHDGLQAVAEGRLEAFVHNYPVLAYSVAKRYPESIQMHTQTFDPNYLALPLSPQWQQQKELDIAILEFMQSPAWNSILYKYDALH